MADKRPIFGIFEGGGAKGIAHLGALEAVAENGLEFVGVAGASAGAIVASLVAAGYSHDAIIDPERKDGHILARYRLSPTAILDKGRWKRFGRFRRGLGRFARCTGFGGFLGGFVAAPRTALVAAGLWRRRGYFSTARIRDFVNRAVREGLLDLHAMHGRPDAVVPERVRFRDLDYQRYPYLRPLKIVATDLGKRSLVVFDLRLTPDAEIGEAVAASVAIPTVFEPVTMRSHAGGPFADGGLVSNLPIWIFAEEKLAFERANPTEPPVPIIGFSLIDDPRRSAAAAAMRRGGSFAEFCLEVARTAIFGGQKISQDFVEDLFVVELETKLAVLDFDAPWPAVREAYLEGRRCAAERLKFTLSVKPDRVRAELRRIHGLALAEINRRRQADGNPMVKHLRANLVEEFGPKSQSGVVRGFRVTHAYNMEEDADDRLLLDSRGHGAPAAFASRTIQILPIGPGAGPAGPIRMTKYERALVRPTLRSALCVPVFDDPAVWELDEARRPVPKGVFCLDSDEDLEIDFAQPDLWQLVAAESTLLSLALKESEHGRRPEAR